MRRIITDVNGLVTTYRYEGFGRLIEETRPDGVKTNVIYRLCGAGSCPAHAVYYVRSEVSGAPPTTVYYDLLDRQVRTESVGFNGQPVYVDTVYNRRGEVQRVSEPYVTGTTPLWTEYTYDLLGRTVSETRPNGARTTTTYTGLTVQMTNALNQTSSRTVNVQGWLLRSVDAANNVVTYAYDSAGNLLKVTDPAGNTTTMEYDRRGRKITMRDPDSGLTSYRYNALSELVWQKDAKGQEVTLSYDLLGRMTQRNEPEGVSTWLYDSSAKGVGLLAEVSGPNGYKESYTYDTVSRLIKTTYTLDGQSFVVQTTYDAFSRVDKVTYPGGFKIRNKYTTQGYFKEVRNDATNALYWRADTLNARGQLERVTLGNGLETKQQFDANTGLLRTIQTGPTGNLTQMQNLSFTFDALGNLTSRKDTRQNLTESFTYDALNRLTKAQVTGRDAQTMQYDALGNITFKSDVGSYSYGGNGAGPHAVTAISGGISASFGYDANGNRTSSTGGSINYTSFNLPTTLVQGSNQISYAYGPNHNRYKRTIQASGVTTTTLMIGALYEKETAGALTTQNYYIPAAGQMVAIQVVRSNGANNTLYLHRDHLGSIETITGPTGAVVERLSYDAWGKRRTADWRSINAAITSLVRRGYTGHEQLDEVGLIHMNGRVYDPTLGRFLSPDPFVQAPDFSQSLNRYSYVLNNPLSLTDPSGFNWFSKVWKGVKNFFEDHWKTLVGVAITVITAGWGSGITAAFWGAVFGVGSTAASVAISVTGGLIGGFAGSVVSTLLYGGSLSEALQFGLKEGLVGALRSFDRIVSDVLLPSWASTMKRGSNMARLATQLTRMVARSTISGAISELRGGDFMQGFKLRFGAETVRWGTEAYTGFKQTWQRATQGPVLKEDGKIREGMQSNNNLGTANTTPAELANPCFICEGGPVSRFANLFPGMNSGAVLHDRFAGDLENLSTSEWLNDKLLNPLTNQMTIVPVIGINYVGLGIGNVSYENKLLLERYSSLR